MGLYEEWKALAEQERTQEEHDAYWSAYFDKETEAYKRILTDKTGALAGTLAEVGEKLGLSAAETAGFLDGVNTSLAEEIALENCEADSPIDAKIDFEKLYYNMHKAKAPWLYDLDEWEGVLTAERRREITKRFKSDQVFRAETTVGRNDPCPCGSGKKFKKCCGAAK